MGHGGNLFRKKLFSKICIFVQVVDDPEIKRNQQNSRIISNVAYHGDLEKKAAMEQRRTFNENGRINGDVNEINGNINSIASSKFKDNFKYVFLTDQ